MAIVILCETYHYHPGVKVSYDFVWFWRSAVCQHDTHYNYRKIDRLKNQFPKQILNNQVH
jgi:hypothetical protein